jgi:hypothetical protein
MNIRPGGWDDELYTEVNVSCQDFASSIRRTLKRLPHLVSHRNGDA